MSGRFRFRLEPVLEHRKRIEDEKQQRLADCERELRAAQDELARLNGEYKRFSGALRDRHRELAAEELRWHYSHLGYLDRRMVAQHATIAELRAAADRARAELIDASKDRKIMDRLKERRFEAHRALEAGLEQKELEESNARRYSRLTREESA